MHTLAQLRAGKLSGSRQLKLASGLKDFPPEIFSLADSLEVLDLSGNALTELPPELAKLQKLRIIFCSNNQFTHLPAVLGTCPELSMIGFKANRINSVPAAALPKKLRWLTLTDNAITALPEEIGQCTELQKLMLAGNQLRRLPDTLAQCQRLELIRIAANQLETLPTWLLRLTRLSWLAYAANPLAASLEAQILNSTLVAEIPWHSLALAERLGEGASGLIHRAHFQAEPGQSDAVAVKLFKGAVTSDGLPLSEMAAAMAAGQHPNLIEVLGKVNDHPTGVNALVLALIDQGFANLAQPPSLASCTRDIYPEDTRFDLAELLQIAAGIAAAAEHLHRQGIMHGDLYGHNILHNSQGHALIGDFGAASFYNTDDTDLADALQRLEVRAFGCLLEELLAHCPPAAEHQPVFELLHALKEACLSEVIATRPLFAAISKKLQMAKQVLTLKSMETERKRSDAF